MLSPDDDVLTTYFERAGYTLTHDAKGRYYRGMWHLMGDDSTAARLLRDELLIRLFSNAQVRKGRAFTYRELLGIVYPSGDAGLSRFTGALHTLLERQILLRGYHLKCPACDLDSWYDLDEIADCRCQGCRSPVRLPLELNFAYRLNRLFAEGLKQGALAVLLTVLLLARPGRLWQAGCVVKKAGEKIDLDLAMLDTTSGALILAECKDNLKTPDVQDVVTQVARSVQVARDIGAGAVLFATLRDTLPDAITAFLRQVSADSPAMRAGAALRQDLLSGRLKWPEGGTVDDEREDRALLDIQE